MLAALLVALAPGAAQAEPFDIDVVLPLPGTGAFMGKTQQQALTLEEKLFNEEGGISGYDAVMTRWNAEKTMFEAVSQPGGDEMILR